MFARMAFPRRGPTGGGGDGAYLGLLSALKVWIGFADQVEILLIKNLLLFALGSTAFLAPAASLI